MLISFHGADRDVTGSCHMLEVEGLRVLIDCGLFQGGRELDEHNAEEFGFEPRAIDVVLLTHAHLDHCGRLPLLVKRGFRGEIVATAATRELARLVMLDAAHLHEEDAAHHRRHPHGRAHDGRRGRNDRTSHAPLYETVDALDAIERFARVVDYGETLELGHGLTATFHDAGHILGAASIRIVRSGPTARSVVFSGDIGNSGRPILRDPQPPPHADVVVMETTYGNRLHKRLQPSVEELYDAVTRTLGRGGNVVIPTFALERAQELLFHLRVGSETGRLPRDLPVFLDSPMAISATEIFRRHPECYDRETTALFASGHDPFALPGLEFTRDTAASRAINTHRGGAVIMAGAGMCTGGRVRHHLRHNLPRRDASVVFVGYAAEHTLARILIDGAKRVKLFGEEIPVEAEIFTLGGFSAHADRDELLAWHRAVAPSQTILVHGEPTAMESFARHLHDQRVQMPQRGDVVAL
ncbi:MAG: MBL fold metallo-hydrolase [Planctomycetes bacterium]|nr:MBL fold metallo-hydrolase [Planctomycetota bacterium]